MPVRALNLYYAREASFMPQVLATRLRASKVREAIGVPHGRIFLRVNGDNEAPDVMWDCPFADAAGHERDMDARAGSAEFESVRATMRTLTRRFERVLYGVEASAVHAADALPAGTRIAQAWVQELDAGAIRLGETFAADTSVLRRLDDNRRLPQWIVETSASRKDDLAGQVERWLAHSHMQPALFTWERVA